jgi:hypothetical protein
MVRPTKTGPIRSKVVQMRVSEAELEALHKAAENERRTLSDWLRIIAVDEAGRVNDRAAKKAK